MSQRYLTFHSPTSSSTNNTDYRFIHHLSPLPFTIFYQSPITDHVLQQPKQTRRNPPTPTRAGHDTRCQHGREPGYTQQASSSFSRRSTRRWSNTLFPHYRRSSTLEERILLRNEESQSFGRIVIEDDNDVTTYIETTSNEAVGRTTRGVKTTEWCDETAFSSQQQQHYHYSSSINTIQQQGITIVHPPIQLLHGQISIQGRISIITTPSIETLR